MCAVVVDAVVGDYVAVAVDDVEAVVVVVGKRSLLFMLIVFTAPALNDNCSKKGENVIISLLRRSYCRGAYPNQKILFALGSSQNVL